MQDLPTLPDGYAYVPPGKVASVVTCLEMKSAPPLKPVAQPLPPFTLDRWEKPALAAYSALFRAIGENWLWYSRLNMPDAELAAVIHHADVEVYALCHDGAPAGLLELDFREEGQCELAFFGITEAAIGQGHGRYLIEQAIARAWTRPIGRFWVHTCTLDHPGALGFYVKAGFMPYARMIEVGDDPRLTGKLSETAAAQVPIIK